MSEQAPVLHRGVGTPSKCRSCQATIVWAVHGTTGKSHPWEADAKGVWTIENGVARHVGPAAAQSQQIELGAPAPSAPAATGSRYTSHFSTCPHAKKWRR